MQKANRMFQTTAPHDEFYFMRERVVDVDAAVVGISKMRWVGINETDANKDSAVQIMKVNRFDVLPILQINGSVSAYFQTSEWGNYSSINRAHISHRDVLPLHTHVRDVLKSFVLENRYFYFLTNEERIAGLISIVNFNCRQVKIYLFSLISELEIGLGQLLSQNLTDDQIVSTVASACVGRNRAEVMNRIEADRSTGVEVRAVEYLYLSQLLELILAKKLHHKLTYHSDEEFRTATLPIRNLRNQIAHPTKSLITHPESCRKLWDTIDSIEEVLFALRQLL